jgi:hypothetical protein
MIVRRMPQSSKQEANNHQVKQKHKENKKELKNLTL